MPWFQSLLFGNSAAQAIVAVSLAIALGIAVGNIKIRGVGLGVGGVLFSALILGHMGMTPQSHAIIEFVREFGLILFVFSIGLQVGPGFVDSLRRRGVRLNLMAALVVFLGVICTLFCAAVFEIPAEVAVGLFSGAVTNTPSLAAASQMFQEIMPPDAATKAMNMAGLGYAVAYPFGIMGIILTMLLVRFLCRVNVHEEARAMEQILSSQHAPVSSVTLKVQNPGIVGTSIAQLRTLLPEDCSVSRVASTSKAFAPRPTHIIEKNMRLHVVCYESELPQLYAIIGPVAEEDLRTAAGDVEARPVVVTRQFAIGKSVQKLGLIPETGVTVTRMVRAGTEFSPTPHVNLHFGDRLLMVGEKENLDKAERIVGNELRKMEHPHVLPLFLGILVGVIIGSIPVALPNLPAPIKLGLAGGPLLTAIMLSRLSTFCGMNWYMPNSANLILREVGIALFLACVGLNAGDRFFQALADGTGFYWMSVASIITLVPMLVAGFMGRILLKCNYASSCGLMAGSMTDPPALAFATQSLESDAPASVYATVYPLTMVLRILAGQCLVLILCT